MTGPRPGLGHLDPDAHLRDPAGKQRYVNALFATIAPSYDRFTRWFSFGMDRRWKAQLVRLATEGLSSGGLVLDLACGTGDIGWAVGRLGGCGVIGLDPSAEMLRLAQGRHRRLNRPTAQPPHRLLRADMLALPIRPGAAAAVTVGYGFRNVPDVERALAEVVRVLRPGGRLVSLDFFLPAWRPWRGLYRWYLRRAGRAVGRWWHGEPEAYGYIDRSLDGWRTCAAFSVLLEAAGLEVERVVTRLGGGIGLHAGRKPG